LRSYSKSCSIWHWMVWKAVWTGCRWRSSLYFIIPSTDNSVARVMIERVKCWHLVCFFILYVHCVM